MKNPPDKTRSFAHIREPIAGKKRPAASGFWCRAGSTVALWGLLLVALLSSNPLLSNSLVFLAILSIGGLGLGEFFRMMSRLPVQGPFATAMIGGQAYLIIQFLVFWTEPESARHAISAAVDLWFLPFYLMGLFAQWFFKPTSKDGMVGVGLGMLGFFYVPWLLSYLVRIYYFPGPAGPLYVLYFILITKFSDLGAYVIGSLIGRHKAIPAVSPGKTWEGLGGGLMVATLVSVAAAYGLGDRLPGMTLFHGIVLGVLLGATAAAGDGVESLMKRRSGLKDTGEVIPGIGGVLDLMDSLLFNAPLGYLYLRYILDPNAM